MPTIRLTESQASAVRGIMDAQAGRKVGYVAVLNWHFDFSTGEKVAELDFVALRWADAVKIARMAGKLAAENKSELFGELKSERAA